MAGEEKGTKTIQVPTFSGAAEDFDLFWPRFEAYAEARGFYDAISIDPIDPDLPCDPKVINTDQALAKKEEAAIKRNKQAMAAFTLAFTSKALMNRVTKARTEKYPRGLAYKVTEGLMKKYRPTDRVSKVEAKAALREVKMGTNEDPDEFFNKLAAVQQTYQDSGLTDEELITEAMVKVPQKYKSIIAGEIRSKGANVALDDIQDAMNVMFRMENNSSISGSETNQEDEKVLLAANQDIKCYKCGKLGHKAYQCKEKGKRKGKGRGKKAKFSGTCNNCGKVGHREDDCWELEKNSSRRPKNWKSSKADNSEVGAATTEYCMVAIDGD